MVEYKKRKILFDPSTKQDKLIAGANIQITHTEGGDIISSSSGGEPIDMSAYLSKIEASSTYQEKGNYAYKSDIPSLVGYALKSEIPSLNGYAKLTDIPSLEGYAKTTDIPDVSNFATKSEIPSLIGYATESYVLNYHDSSKQDVGDYALRSELPIIPTNISAFTNDVDYVKRTDRPTTTKAGVICSGNWLKVNAETGKLECGELTVAQYQTVAGYTFISKTTLENVLSNKGYITSSYHDSTKQDVISDLDTIRERADYGAEAHNMYDNLQDTVDTINSNFMPYNIIASLIDEKQDIISDLSTIRSGAIDGEMAYSAINNMGDIISYNASDFQPAGNYALKSEIPTIPTNVSAFNNDSGYLTQHQSIKTINGESIIGTGNVEIQGGGASIEVNYYDD